MNWCQKDFRKSRNGTKNWSFWNTVPCIFHVWYIVCLYIYHKISKKTPHVGRLYRDLVSKCFTSWSFSLVPSTYVCLHVYIPLVPSPFDKMWYSMYLRAEFLFPYPKWSATLMRRWGGVATYNLSLLAYGTITPRKNVDQFAHISYAMLVDPRGFTNGIWLLQRQGTWSPINKNPKTLIFVWSETSYSSAEEILQWP